MFFPEYNAFLVPAETLYPNENHKPLRRRPMENLVKLIQQRRIQPEINRSTLDRVNNNITSENDKINKKQNISTIQLLKETENNSKKSEKEENENVSSEQQSQTTEEQAFPQIGQFFQRPNNSPIFPSLSIRPQVPQFQFNRPISSFFPSGITSWRPFSNLFQQNAETPRNHYVTNHYMTKSTPLQTYPPYYLEQYPLPSPQRMSHFTTYADDVQDFISHIEESVMKETTTNDNDDTSMMLASLPIGKNTPTSLLLRPVAKAVAGAKGVAVASPVARAVLRKGENVNIDFDPDAVAIAGPGGQAHAHPKLIVSYSNDTKSKQ